MIIETEAFPGIPVPSLCCRLSPALLGKFVAPLAGLGSKLPSGLSDLSNAVVVTDDLEHPCLGRKRRRPPFRSLGKSITEEGLLRASGKHCRLQPVFLVAANCS